MNFSHIKQLSCMSLLSLMALVSIQICGQLLPCELITGMGLKKKKKSWICYLSDFFFFKVCRPCISEFYKYLSRIQKFKEFLYFKGQICHLLSTTFRCGHERTWNTTSSFKTVIWTTEHRQNIYTALLPRDPKLKLLI